MIELPPFVRQRVANLGEAGEQWLGELPGVVADLSRHWSVTVDAVLTGGTAAYVARVHRPDGTHAVLKIAIPRIDITDQVDVLAAADGRGYAQLYDADVERRAMLLESLGPSLDHAALPPERALGILCATLNEAWTLPRRKGIAVEPDQENAHLLAVMIGTLWEKLDRPCPDAVITAALAYAERRAVAFDLDTSVIVHGDPHPANTLRAHPRPGAESGYVFVDPDGLIADRSYDLGVAIRDWRQELLPRSAADACALLRRLCAVAAAETGVDETAIWEWGFIQRVSTGLYLLSMGIADEGRSLLRSAELLVDD